MLMPRWRSIFYTLGRAQSRERRNRSQLRKGSMVAGFSLCELQRFKSLARVLAANLRTNFVR